MGRDLPADPGPAADTDVEDARKDGHGHRGCPHRDVADEFGLEGDVEQRRRTADDQAGGDHRPCPARSGLPQEERDDQAQQTSPDDAIAEMIVKPGKDETPQEAADAEEHERRRDALVAKGSNGLEKGLDIAVRCKIGRRKQDGQDIDADDDGILEQLGQVVAGKSGVAGQLGKDKGQIDEHGQGRYRNDQKSHAPAGIEADDPSQGQAEDHGDSRASDDHAQGQGPMSSRDQARRHRGRNGPENRMGAGDADAGCHEHGKIQGQPRCQLSQDKEPHRPQQEAPHLHLADEEHERQGQQGHDPGVDSNHNARLGLGHREGLRNVHEQADRHEFRRIEDERRHSQAQEGQYIFQGNSVKHDSFFLCIDLERFHRTLSPGKSQEAQKRLVVIRQAFLSC